MALSFVAIAAWGTGAAGQGRPVAQTAADRAAAAFVRAAIDSHWVKGPDGWTTQFQLRDVMHQPLEGVPPAYRQYRDIKFTITRGRVSEAQRLNGTDYGGTVTFANTASRVYLPIATTQNEPGWSDWVDDLPSHERAVERRNGQWVISDDQIGGMLQHADLFEGLKPEPAKVPTANDTLQVFPPCDKFGRDYNAASVCFDTGPIPLTPTSPAMGGPLWEADQSQGAVTLPPPAGASVTPSPALLLIKVSPEGRTLEASAWFSSSPMFTEAAVNMAKNLRWNPALRRGKQVQAWVLWEFHAQRR